MKNLIVAVCCLALGVACADTGLTTNATEKAKKPHKDRGTWEQRQFGGFATKPNSAKGKVVVLNAQKIVPAADFRAAVDYISKEVNPEIAIVDADAVKTANPMADIVQQGGKLGVVLVDSPDLPALLTAPENRWSIVNVAALKDGAKDAAALAKRVRIEILRGFALASGCAFMTRDPIVMKMGVLIPEDLDVIKEEAYGVEIRWTLGMALPTYGITPWKVTTYRQACEEGWANAPTNKWQKKIWDKVHEIPSQPLTIKYEGKKDK